jgi:hypothetical protein
MYALHKFDDDALVKYHKIDGSLFSFQAHTFPSIKFRINSVLPKCTPRMRTATLQLIDRSFEFLY